jgi:hypothetical protein
MNRHLKTFNRRWKEIHHRYQISHIEAKQKEKMYLAIEITQFTSDTVPAMSTGYGK